MNVSLVARTEVLIDGVELDEFSAFIARIGKVKDEPEKLIRYLIRHKHWSPFEHTFFTFKIETSLAIGRELLRHRSGVFQERSLRYEASIGCEPIELRKQSETNRQSSTEVFDPVLSLLDMPASLAIDLHLQAMMNLYEALLEAGVARECARFILPSCTSTTMLFTNNVRNWIHFLSVRDHGDAQKEMQIIAKAIGDILLQQLPVTFKAAQHVPHYS